MTADPNDGLEAWEAMEQQEAREQKERDLVEQAARLEPDPALAYARSVAAGLAGRDEADASLLLDGTARPGKKTNRAHAEAELEALRQQLAGEVPTAISHLKLVVSKNVSTLGDVAEVLRGLQAAGVTEESLMYVIDRVYFPGWEARPVAQ